MGLGFEDEESWREELFLRDRSDDEAVMYVADVNKAIVIA
jgi:hypothetical protein